MTLYSRLRFHTSKDEPPQDAEVRRGKYENHSACLCIPPRSSASSAVKISFFGSHSPANHKGKSEDGSTFNQSGFRPHFCLLPFYFCLELRSRAFEDLPDAIQFLIGALDCSRNVIRFLIDGWTTPWQLQLFAAAVIVCAHALRLLARRGRRRSLFLIHALFIGRCLLFRLLLI